MDLGFGFVGVGDDPDEVVVIPQGALDAAGIDPLPWWPVARDYLERMGALAAQRLAANPVMRPIGDCDVVTLLGSRALREALCGGDGTACARRPCPCAAAAGSTSPASTPRSPPPRLPPPQPRSGGSTGRCCSRSTRSHGT